MLAFLQSSRLAPLIILALWLFVGWVDGQSLGQTPRASTSGAIVREGDMGRDTSLYRGRLGPPGGTARVTDIGINLPCYRFWEGRLLYGGTGENTRQVRVSRAVQGLSAGEGRPKGIWVELRSAGHSRISRKVASTQGSGLREAPWKREDERQLPAVDSTPSLVLGQRNRTSLGMDGVQSSADTQVAMGEKSESSGVPPSVGEPPPSLPEQQQAHPEGAERGDDGDVARMGNDTPNAGAVAAGLRAPERVDRGPAGQVSDRSGRATYYHPSLAGGLMRDGVTRYWPDLTGVVSSNDYPLGTRLLINGVLSVVVSDTGHLAPGSLDLSERDFIYLAGSLEPGVIAVEIGVP